MPDGMSVPLIGSRIQAFNYFDLFSAAAAFGGVMIKSKCHNMHERGLGYIVFKAAINNRGLEHSARCLS